ncbi:MAG: TadE/TadG family type IV pilus assembly protein [Actinomycetota bacterium]
MNRRPQPPQRHGNDRDRGLALVEMALVAPLLALLMAGIVEYGMLWRDNLTVTSSTRAAARVVSNLGDNNLADYEALLSLDAGLGAIDGYTVEYVMVYDASAGDGAPSATCFDGNGDPRVNSGGNCNVYTGAQVDSMAALVCEPSCASFPSLADAADCAGGLTFDFCPQAERPTDQHGGLSSIGVWVRLTRDYFTGMFPGDGITMEDYSVMKVEPR